MRGRIEDPGELAVHRVAPASPLVALPAGKATASVLFRSAEHPHAGNVVLRGVRREAARPAALCTGRAAGG